jgi:hypothetical protein
MNTASSEQRRSGRFTHSRPALSRRKFLRGVGTAMSLPLLESMKTSVSRAASNSGVDSTKPRRMLAICSNLSLLPDYFFPTETGRDYELSPYLKLIAEHRRDFTVFTGVSHPDVDGGHPAEEGQSILDAVAGQAKDLQRNVTARDRDRLDQYFSSVRDLEQRMQMSKGWETKPRPVVKNTMPVDPASPKEYMDKVKLMYDMARLAFETDSTRSIALMLDSMHSPAIEFGDTKFTDSYHLMSHHGKKEGKLKLLKAADEQHMKLLTGLFSDLKGVTEEGEPLLDRTMVLYGSNMNSANSHSTTNLPILFAGGGFKHGQHLAFDKDRNVPLPNLFVSMLQRMGIESDRFSSSTGTMRGLEMHG